MRKETKAILLIGFLCCIGIGIGILANSLFPMTFSVYFCVCTLSLLSCLFIKDKAKLIIPWTITATASVIVTLNYLHPDISVYTNADYHTLVMQGVDKKDSVILVGKNRVNSFFDRDDLEGYACITPKNGDSSSCLLHYDLRSEPIFAKVEGSRVGRLLNKEQLPSFTHDIQIENDSIQCKVSFETFERDSIRVDVSFKHTASPPQDSLQPSFKQPINIGYNLYDLLHSGISYQESEEALLDALRNTLIVRDHDNKDLYYMTYPRSMEKIQLSCDGNQFQKQKGRHTAVLGKDTYFYMGIGSKSTRPMKASYEHGYICLRYQFPYINNFPGLSDNAKKKNNIQKIVAVTTKTASLLKANVNEAFFYPLFEQEENGYHFNGNINYRINQSGTPFLTTLTDNRQERTSASNTLTAKNGAVWHFSVCNLRQTSPVTGEENKYVQDNTIVGLVFLMLFLAFIWAMLLTSGHTSKAMMTAWLFAIPLFTMRIYLLWRIAVFPPVSDITLNEFLRYRMELPSMIENPVLVLIGLWLLLPLLPPIIWGMFRLVAWVVAWVCSKFNFGGSWQHKRYQILFGGIIILSIGASIVIKLSHLNLVGLNILVPVILFIINEYIIVRELSVRFRIINAIVALGALLLSDPGYAIMFFIFECVYYSIMLYAFLKPRWRERSSGKAAGFYFFIVLLSVICVITILPTLVSWLYSSNPSLLGFVSTSRLMFFIVPLFVGGPLLFIIWHWREFDSRKSYWIAFAIMVALIVSSTTWVYDYFQTHNLHFKYRAIIHTETVGEIMQDERYGGDDAQRLLNAAQNQWFLQYQINKGKERITDDGILSLSPHFKKGVTWGTQISDVILSRYVIGELSGLVPLFMILLALVFVWITFQNKNGSPAGRALSFAIALLFLIQSTFEWIAVTNRTIFFGQDFPFMSQNARVTLYMFGIWLILWVIFSCYTPEDEDNEELGEGLELFAKPFQQRFFFILYALVVGFIFVKGNHYDELYAGKKAQGDKFNAEEFNIFNAIKKSNHQIAEINFYLANYPANGKSLKNNEDISALIDDIEEKIHLTDYVNKLKDEGRINDFTYSLYEALVSNLKRSNSNSNIIHLRHHDMESYELALNHSYFNLQSPDFDKKAWKGNIYSDVSSHANNNLLATAELPGMVVYAIPRSWLPSNRDFAIVDCRVKDGHIGENFKRYVHKEMADYISSTAVFPISTNDILELYDKKRNDMITYQFGREEQNIIVKNMVINGKRKFFYPLKEKCLWLRDFSNLMAYNKQGTGSSDSVFVTLDSKLTESISRLLQKTGKECSVVAMDGWGNVRVMADHKLSGSIDPNNEELLNELATQSYMNPNPEVDQNLFGNLNLCYLKPGPGSSLKPITYAAVTSQSKDIDWPELMLMSPKYIKDTTVSKVVGNYYHIRKYGPQYKYGAKRPFKSIKDDEEGVEKNGINWISNDFYLYQSSNYYNALITYLGHYDNLANAEKNVFVASTSSNDFPRFRTKQDGRVYTFRNAPQARANLILFDGLTKNFRMPTFTESVDTLRYDFINPSHYREKDLESKAYLSTRFSWVFPQASSIYDYEMRESELTPAERLRQYTLGSDPVKVTPMKMAEMYGKLYSLHPDFHASITPRRTGFNEPWLDRNGNASDKFFQFYQENLFQGMEKCVQIGTARFLTKNVNGYHLYAKTGTLSFRNGENDDRMLAVIISNKSLTDSKNIKSANDYKYVVVYFRFKQLEPKSSIFWDTINAAIPEIINSTSFNNYMK